MAIPFNLPTDEQTEDNYRRLDQLLADLYSVLRQILFRPTCVPEFIPNINGEPGDEGRLQPAPGSDVSGSRRADLPDVVSSTLSAPSHCPCRRRRHRRRRRASSCCPGEAESPSNGGQSRRVERPLRSARREDQWLVVGEQLRKIAEEFRMTFRKTEMPKEETEQQQRDLRMEVKTTGLFSLLVPAHFRSSIWTTVILLVGWRLLTRAR